MATTGPIALALALTGGAAQAAASPPLGALPLAGLAGMLLVMGLAVAAFAYRHSHERGAGLGLGAWLLCLALTAVLTVTGAGLSPGLALGLHLSLAAFGTWCSIKFLLHRPVPMPLWQDLALFGQLLLLPALAVALRNHANPNAALLLHSVPLLLTLESLLALTLSWKRRASLHVAKGGKPEPSPGSRRPEARFAPALLALCGLGLLATAVAAMPVAPGLNGLQDISAWLALLLPAALLAMGLQYLLGFARDRVEAEKEHAQFEQRMQERVSEMERNFGVIAEQRLEQVTERERKRIAADLHDDLGAKLLTIVHTSESDRISSLAREALEEMRLSVRGLTGKPVQLLDALGDWRAEVVSRLGQANINAEWKSPSEDLVHTLPARAYVQTTRIFREAVSNIIKHSGGTNCMISCSVQDGDFVVVIQDNGQGIPAELDGRLDRGHGMASMKSRAKQMQGQCLVESGPGWGTVIRLTIPL